MSQIAFDNIESGTLTNFTGTDVSGASSSIAASTSANKNGTYGISAVANNTGSTSDRAVVYKGFTENANLKTYLNFWFQFNSHSNVGFGSGQSKGIARIGNDGSTGANTDSTGRAFYLIFPTTTYQLQGAYRKADGTGDTTFGTAISFTPATWYAIRMLLDKSGTDPVLTWWSSTDGISYTQQGTFTDTTAGVNGTRSTINQARVGAVHNGQFEAIVGTFYFDDFEIRDDLAATGVTLQERHYPRGAMRGVLRGAI